MKTYQKNERRRKERKPNHTTESIIRLRKTSIENQIRKIPSNKRILSSKKNT